MIKFGRWVRGGDNEPLARISVTHYLDREQLAWTLAAATVPSSYEDLRELTKAEIEQHVRDQLRTNPEQMNWWRDNYTEDYDNEPTADEVEAWARKQVEKL